jgi:hypothetical protein
LNPVEKREQRKPYKLPGGNGKKNSDVAASPDKHQAVKSKKRDLNDYSDGRNVRSSNSRNRSPLRSPEAESKKRKQANAEIVAETAKSSEGGENSNTTKKRRSFSESNSKTSWGREQSRS